MPDPARLRRLLLRWYRAHGRELPWRATASRPDPYRVWLAEIMLQQTRVAAATPYIESFLVRWPTVHDLAAAELDDVLAAWAGLGYYARARNLHRCARVVAGDHGGVFPDSEPALRALPGVGPYTAGAVAAIAFGRRAAAVDGNVERVLARIYGIETPLPAARPELRARAAALVPARRPGDWTQALFDLGATVCTPRTPDCGACPWRRDCVAFARDLTAVLPNRAPPPPRPTRHGAAFWLVRDGAVLLRRRPPSGLLGGMLELPGTPWGDAPWSDSAASAFAPAGVRWQRRGTVRHTFTHFHLELAVLAGRTTSAAAIPGLWTPATDADLAPLPTVMKKAARLALATPLPGS